VTIEFIFDENSNAPVRQKVVHPAVVLEKKKTFEAKPAWTPNKNFIKTTYPVKKKEPSIDVSDTAKWPLANLLLQQFPGTITDIRQTI
jgi:hypothetical protein